VFGQAGGLRCRCFEKEYLNSPDKRLQSDGAAARGGPKWGNDSDDEIRGLRIGALVFLPKQNNQGRTAAYEARMLGYIDMAAWLERVVKLDDPQGRWAGESVVQLLGESWDNYYGL
jgi:hypothetical protein